MALVIGILLSAAALILAGTALAAVGARLVVGGIGVCAVLGILTPGIVLAAAHLGIRILHDRFGLVDGRPGFVPLLAAGAIDHLTESRLFCRNIRSS